MIKSPKICVIGAGNWGKNHIRTLNEIGALGGIVEKDSTKIKQFKESYPKVDFFENLDSSLKKIFDGYIISTPPSTHSEISIKLIKNNKPILIEKPLALSLNEAKKIKLIADKLSAKVVIGHLLLFHPAIIKMKSIIKEGLIGNIQYIYSNRLKLGIVRNKENALWSFAPHDISLFQFFIESFPTEVCSKGGVYLQDKIHDTIITHFKYKRGIKGHIFVNWLHPFKESRLVIIGSKGSLHFDDSIDERLLFYDKKIKQKSKIISLYGKSPKNIDYEKSEPLMNEIKYFIDVINGKPLNKSKLDEGIDVVKILEIATNSLNVKNN